MSVENKKDNLTTKTITRTQAKNNPKLAEIIEENRKKAFETKTKTLAEEQKQINKNLNSPFNKDKTSASTSQKLGLSGISNQDTSIIISSSTSSIDQSISINPGLFDKSIFDTSNLTGNSTIIDKFDCTLTPSNIGDYKEQLSESSNDSDQDLNYNHPEKIIRGS